jgi:hypothetical protein
MTARATALPMIPLQGGVKPARDDRGELCAIAEEHAALLRVAALAAQERRRRRCSRLLPRRQDGCCRLMPRCWAAMRRTAR